MHRSFPAILAAVTAMLIVVNTLVVSRPLEALAAQLIDWAIVIGAVALLLGIVNLLQVHGRRLISEQITVSNRAYSLILLVSMVFTLIVGLIVSGTNGPGLVWIFTYIYRPLGASFFALIAFFVVTAAYRSLRISSPAMGLLLATAVIVLIGLAPLELVGLPALLPLRDVSGWFLSYPSVALQRGILISTALGATLATLRILFGMDRHYLE